MDLPRNCEIFITADGSPTLQWRNDEGYGEKMHHSAGALSESVFIYHSGLARALELGFAPPRILSLGLGLGYNEFLAIAELGKRQVPDWKLWSFETQAFLRDGFREFLQDKDGAVSDLYSKVLALVAARLDLDPARLKSWIAEAAESGTLELRGSFPEDTHAVTGCTCVFFDAYSKKMNPELWEERRLISALKSLLAPRALLTTYAATGSLNRVLRALGFRLMPRPGFQGKRESTLAIRD